MNRKLPDEAFDYYVGLGVSRSHAAVAKQYGVSKRCVTKRAVAEKWSERLEKIQSEARVISDQKITDTVAEMNERHLKMARLMAARALEGLRNYPLSNAMEAVRAGEMALKLERLIAGESPEKGQVSIEEIYRQETRLLLQLPVEEEPAAAEVIDVGLAQ